MNRDERFWKLFLVVVAFLYVYLIAAIAMAVNVRDFIPEDVTDWGPTIQEAIDSLKDPKGGWSDASGGALHFPKGRYPVKTPILLDCPGLLITGEGSPNSYACTIEWQGTDPQPESDDPRTPLPPRTALFTFVGPDEKRQGPTSAGFRMSNIRIKGNKHDKENTGIAFRFGPKGSYCKGFIFDGVTFEYFAKVFEFAAGPSRTWGGLVCTNCTCRANGQVVDATQGGANEWRFRDCMLSKNGLGWAPAYAFDFLGGDGGIFDGCILEGMPRALRVRRFQQLRITGCRFEGNATSKDPVVWIEDSNGVHIQAYHRVLGSEEKPTAPPTIMLRDCHDYDVSPQLGKVHIERRWEGRY